MTWPTVKFGEVMTVGRGSSPRPIKDERFFTGGTIPWVKIADATASGKFIYHTNQHVNEYGASFSRKLKPGALIFPASGTLGIPRFLGIEACIHDGWLYFADYQGIDPDWLYYRIILLKNYYEGIAYGAAIQNINTDIVRNTEIQLPDLHTQHAMAAVLAAYDDLIATNQRRIALLEDAARRLYREWFVHLRFPSHESVPVKDGVPEGWQPASFTDLVSINPRIPFAKDVERPFVEMSALSETSMIIGQRSRRIIGGGARFRNGDTLFARITPCTENGKTGFVQFLEDDDAVASGSTEFIVFRSAKVNPWWVYCTAREDNFREHAIRSMAGSDGRQRVNPRCFDQFAMLQPFQPVLDQFEHVVGDSFTQIEILCNQNEQLAHARDLLLPKLMSGQLDVSGIRLPEEVAA